MPIPINMIKVQITAIIASKISAANIKSSIVRYMSLVRSKPDERLNMSYATTTFSTNHRTEEEHEWVQDFARVMSSGLHC
ncbi:hypothetical protein V1504DRAFT_463297 [Lipomyces starkeyi]